MVNIKYTGLTQKNYSLGQKIGQVGKVQYF